MTVGDHLTDQEREELKDVFGDDIFERAETLLAQFHEEREDTDGDPYTRNVDDTTDDNRDLLAVIAE